MTLGERLQALRKERRWSRRFVAAQVGVTEQSVINWEHGMYRPRTDKVRALERVYGISLKEVSDEK